MLAYLRLFSVRRFPLDHQMLVSLALRKDGEITFAAFRALRNVQHPEVRSFALDLLNRGRSRASAAGLLIANYRDGDHAVLERALAEEHDREGYHSRGFDILEIAQSRRARDLAGALLTLYERGPCSNCRERAVVLLHELGALPSVVLKECRYDCNFHLRERARTMIP